METILTRPDYNFSKDTQTLCWQYIVRDRDANFSKTIEIPVYIISADIDASTLKKILDGILYTFINYQIKSSYMKTDCKKWYGTYHNFDCWEVKETGNIFDSSYDDNSTYPQVFIQGLEPTGDLIGRYLVQHRKCKGCGFIETHYSSVKF
jgi:hypothetical protein